MNLHIIEISAPADWNRLFDACMEADLQQTWEYGEAVRDCIGWRPVRQAVMAHETPVALAQVLTKEVPALGPVARIQHGPMFLRPENHSDDDLAATATSAIAALRRFWVAERRTVLHLTPCLLAENALPDDFCETTGLQPSGEALWRSIRVDVAQSEAVLRKNLKRRWRSPLQKAEKAGLSTDVCDTDEGFRFFLEKYQEASVRKGFSWPSPELVDGIRTHAPEAVRLIFSILNGDRLGAMVLCRYATTSFCLAAWNSETAAKYHAHNFLIWQSAVYAKSTGAKWLDLGGTDPKTLPGITKFKQGVGGTDYRLIGNFEAKPEAAADSADYREGLGHVLTGLSLPSRIGAGDDLSAALTEFVVSFVQKLHGDEMTLDDDTPLIEENIIDSLSLVTMVQTLQERFGVDIGVQDITLENFNSIDAIRKFVTSRTHAS
jgi:lipid II:glycine glycyltransferase (peptidoglycan interpeptide bridge formation enzyme)/acyl carrier protein